jgi:ATP-dependent exoDNAse (exonuclease V) alpha subunit
VIDATARAEQLAGRETLGIAVSGSTAERLGADSPALQGQTLTLNALIARTNTGSIHIGPGTTVILDEAGMVDHKRLDALTELRLAGEDVESLRLAYAQHVYRQQGATVNRAVVLTGGWQTSKETAYVQATRARHGTDWHLARDQLGEEGQDPDRITRLAQRMSNSQLQAPSTDYRELPNTARNPTRDPLSLQRLLPHKSWLVRAPRGDAPDRAAERGR